MYKALLVNVFSFFMNISLFFLLQTSLFWWLLLTLFSHDCLHLSLNPSFFFHIVVIQSTSTLSIWWNNLMDYSSQHTLVFSHTNSAVFHSWKEVLFFQFTSAQHMVLFCCALATSRISNPLTALSMFHFISPDIHEN